MNRKILIAGIPTTVIILILLAMLFVFADNDIDRSSVTSNSSIVANWTSINQTLTLNFTFRPNFTDLSNKDFYNITNISIAFPAGTFNFSLNSTHTFGDAGLTGGAWDKYNLSITSFDNLTRCYVVSDWDGVECVALRPNNLTGNKTFQVRFDVEANKSVGTEQFYDIVATVVANDSDAAGNRISDSITFSNLGVDDLAPRLESLNVTDGIYTIHDDDDGDLNNTKYLGNNSDYNITLVLSEYNRKGGVIYLLWNTSSIMPVPGTDGLSPSEMGGVNTINMTTSCRATDVNTQNCTFSAVITNSAGGNASDGGVISFVVWINDSFNHVSIFNNSDWGYNFTVDGTKPTLESLNVTDGIYAVHDDDDGDLNNTKYQGNSTNYNVTVVLSEWNREQGTVYLLWNTSSIMPIPGTVLAKNQMGGTGSKEMTTSCSTTDATIQNCTYSTIITNTDGSNASDGFVLSFVIWVNDTFNHVSILNNSRWGYNFTVDGDKPVLKSLNVTDGIYPIHDDDDGDLNNTKYQSNSTNYNVTVVLSDYNRENSVVYLLWNTSGLMPRPDLDGLDSSEMGGANTVNMTTSCSPTDATVQDCTYSAIITNAGDVNASDGAVLSFVIWVNDTFNHTVAFNNSDWGYNFTVDGTKPKILSLNVTESRYNKRLNNSEGHLNNTKYMVNNSNYNVTVVLQEWNKENGVVFLLWNVSGLMPRPDLDGLGSSEMGGNNTINMTTSCSHTDASVQNCTFSAVITNVGDVNASDGAVLSFVIWVNDTFNHTVAFNNSDWGYNFTVDGYEPELIFNLSSSKITRNQAITITCNTTDTLAGVNSFTIDITNPNAATEFLYSVESYAYQNTSLAGGYNVGCNATDKVGLSASASLLSFLAYDEGAPSGGGGTSISGAAPAEEVEEKAEVDISTEEVATKSMTGKEGESSTFTLDGKTIHKLTFLTVGTDSVFLRIESEPLELTLTLGEMKEVDIDGDGVKDLRLLLKSIKYSVVNIEVTRLEVEKPEEIVEEVTEEEVIGDEEVIAPPVKAPSKAGWWIALMVVLVIIGYFIFRKKPKKKK